jgi:hypothetical protein
VKRRLAIVAVTALGLCAGGTAAQAIGGAHTSATGDWGCAVVRPINQGVCFENPLPRDLPSVQTPTVPPTPA